MDIKEMIFSLMMMDFDEHDIGEITKPARNVIVDQIVELAKAKKKIKGLEADREILSRDINYHNCNTCDRACEYRPCPGEKVRANCFKWMQVENPVNVPAGKCGEQE